MSQEKTSGKLKKITPHKKYDKRLVRNKRVSRENAMRTFYKELDLPEFKEALSYSKDPKFQMLLYAINNPRLRGCSFAQLCKKCDLTVNDVSTIWRDHQMSIGMMRAMGHIPQVMEDVAVDSKSRVVTCYNCNGTGRMPDGTVFNNMQGGICKECHGDGKIRINGDKDARNLLYESVGLKKSGSQFNQNMNVNVGTSMPSLEDVIIEAEKALDIVATEVIDNEVRSRAEEAFKEIGIEAGPDPEDPGAAN